MAADAVRDGGHRCRRRFEERQVTGSWLHASGKLKQVEKVCGMGVTGDCVPLELEGTRAAPPPPRWARNRLSKEALQPARAGRYSGPLGPGRSSPA